MKIKLYRFEGWVGNPVIIRSCAATVWGASSWNFSHKDMMM